MVQGTSGKRELQAIQVTTDHQAKTGGRPATDTRQHRSGGQVGGVIVTGAVVTVGTDIATITVHGKALYF